MQALKPVLLGLIAFFAFIWLVSLVTPNVFVDKTELVTTAPDGVQLWKYQGWSNSYPVYFSKSGTQTTEHVYKGQQRDVEVPNDER